MLFIFLLYCMVYCSFTDLFTIGKGTTSHCVHVCTMNPRQFPFGNNKAYCIHSFKTNILANLTFNYFKRRLVWSDAFEATVTRFLVCFLEQTGIYAGHSVRRASRPQRDLVSQPSRINSHFSVCDPVHFLFINISCDRSQWEISLGS